MPQSFAWGVVGLVASPGWGQDLVKWQVKLSLASLPSVLEHLLLTIPGGTCSLAPAPLLHLEGDFEQWP